jgi:hypothetical protein
MATTETFVHGRLYPIPLADLQPDPNQLQTLYHQGISATQGNTILDPGIRSFSENSRRLT